MEKKEFLKTFDDFLDSVDNGCKCYFKLVSGQECQGWISDINEETFEYLDSGPLSRDEPYTFAIADIDVKTFAYWDEEIKTWTEYFVPDKTENRKRTAQLSRKD